MSSPNYNTIIRRQVVIHSQMVQRSPEQQSNTSSESLTSVLASPDNFFVPTIEAIASSPESPAKPHSSELFEEVLSGDHTSGYGSIEKSKQQRPTSSTYLPTTSKWALEISSTISSPKYDMDVESELTPVHDESEYIDTFDDNDMHKGVVIPETPEKCESPDMFASTDDDDRMSESYEYFETRLSTSVMETSSTEDGSYRSRHSTPIRSRSSGQSSDILQYLEPEVIFQTAPEPQLEYFQGFQERHVLSCPPQIVKDPVEQRTLALIAKIENVFKNFVESLMSEDDMVIRVRRQNKWANTEFEDDMVVLKSTQEAEFKDINFRNKNSERKFAIVVSLLGEVHKLLATGTSCTPRELYYRNLELYETQTDVNQAIREICCLLEATPWELQIMPTSKGLVAGALKIVTSNDDIVDCAIEGGVLMPHSVASIRRLDTVARFVLLVEKDTVYKRLLDSSIFDKLGYDMIMITGKGYPDVNTRLLLKMLYDQHRLPIYALTDADPHGVEIMFTYRFGSLAQSHNSEHLAIPSIRWIGVHPSDIERYHLPALPLTSDDESKLTGILKRPYINSRLHQEIQHMLATRLKAEIEGVSAMGMNYLVDDYIPRKLNDNIVI